MSLGVNREEKSNWSTVAVSSGKRSQPRPAEPIKARVQSSDPHTALLAYELNIYDRDIFIDLTHGFDIMMLVRGEHLHIRCQAFPRVLHPLNLENP